MDENKMNNLKFSPLNIKSEMNKKPSLYFNKKLNRKYKINKKKLTFNGFHSHI
jgi:hypothetical protein